MERLPRAAHADQLEGQASHRALHEQGFSPPRDEHEVGSDGDSCFDSELAVDLKPLKVERCARLDHAAGAAPDSRDDAVGKGEF